MEKEKLHRFFAGTASVEEGLSIKRWMEASDENKHAFYRERRVFDAISLHCTSGREEASLSPRSLRLIGSWAKVAAVALLTLTFHYAYETYRKNNEPVGLYTVTVPAGQRTSLTLPDGTEIWLNARSVLQYPVNFGRDNRKVHLKGEAYFDVTGNRESPFIVHTEHYKVEVMGTQFNVEAYPDDRIFETALMRGSVKVSSLQTPTEQITLTPGHKVSAGHGRLQVSKVEDLGPYRWKEGLICFKDQPFRTIVETLERYYDVRIVIRNRELLRYSYNGKFRQSDGIDYALQVLQKDVHFYYEKDTEKQLIYID